MLDVDPQLERKNLFFGLALLGVFLVLFAASMVVAFVYLAIAG